MTQPSKLIARYIRARMARDAITRPQVATVLGVTQQSLSRRLTEKQPFTIDEVDKLVAFLGIDYVEMVNEVGRMRETAQGDDTGTTRTRGAETDAHSVGARKKKNGVGGFVTVAADQIEVIPPDSQQPPSERDQQLDPLPRRRGRRQ